MPKSAMPVVVEVILLEIPLRRLILTSALGLINLKILFIYEVQWAFLCIIFVLLTYCAPFALFIL